jgi:hypothetical protein
MPISIRSAVEGRGESREPLARDGHRMRGCHRGRVRSGCLAGFVTAIVPIEPSHVSLIPPRRRASHGGQSLSVLG